jgi:hypothetical protein
MYVSTCIHTHTHTCGTHSQGPDWHLARAHLLRHNGALEAEVVAAMQGAVRYIEEAHGKESGKYTNPFNYARGLSQIVQQLAEQNMGATMQMQLAQRVVQSSGADVSLETIALVAAVSRNSTENLASMCVCMCVCMRMCMCMCV